MSWTEPTAYAVLALLSVGEMEPAGRGLRWLQAARRPDGGWPPQAGLDDSTWVTALVALLPPEHLGEPSHAGALHWLAGQTGEESTRAERLRDWLMGSSPSKDAPAWPWVPGAAAWVTPTSLAILALEKECRRKANAGLQRRIDLGREFLLQRMCKEGGWNHGSAQAMGYQSHAYPETTGQALAALRGVRGPKVEVSLALAQRFLQECRSADAYNWLRLGLLVQGQLPTESSALRSLPFRTLPEAALDLMVTAAIQGRHDFLG